MYRDLARSNHAWIISPYFQHLMSYLFLQVVPLFTCLLYIYIYINIYLPTNQNFGTSEVVGMSALSFGNWCQHIFVNPEDAMQGKVLKSDQRSTGATAETGLQYLS